jgi:hypothetical protein
MQEGSQKTSGRSKDVVATLGPQATAHNKFFLLMETWIRIPWRTSKLDLFLDARGKVKSQLGQQVCRDLAMLEGSQVSRVRSKDK